MDILILALAVWRASSLLANEDGPYNIFERARMRLGARYLEDGVTRHGTNELSKGVICVWCNSVWIGAIAALAYYLAPTLTTWLALPLALSAIAIVTESAVNG